MSEKHKTTSYRSRRKRNSSMCGQVRARACVCMCARTSAGASPGHDQQEKSQDSQRKILYTWRKFSMEKENNERRWISRHESGFSDFFKIKGTNIKTYRISYILYKGDGCLQRKKREKVGIRRIIKPTENCVENKAKPWEQQVPEWGEEEALSQLSGRPALLCGSSPFTPPPGPVVWALDPAHSSGGPVRRVRGFCILQRWDVLGFFLPFFLFYSCFGLFSRQLP